jgi:hypothetical protein
MTKPSGKNEAERDDTPSPSGATGSRHRRLIEAAVVAGEISATLVAESRAIADYSRRVLARPHIVVTATPADAPAAGPKILVCDSCGGNIATPGIAIMRGRMVFHPHCDARVAA